MPLIGKTISKLKKIGIYKMVPRIFRSDICRPALNRLTCSLHCRLKSTGSDPPEDEVASSSRCKKLYSESYNNLRMHIAHTVVDAGEGSDKNSSTLLESLKERMKSIPRTPRKALVEEEVTIDREMPEEKKTSQTDESFLKVTTEDKVNEERLIQRAEPTDNIGERRSVFDPPHLKSSCIRSSRYYEKQKEALMFDELAKKYLRAERDRIDKNLPQEMERMRVHPIKTSSQTESPLIHVNIISRETDITSEEQNKIPSETDASDGAAEIKKITGSNYGTPEYYKQVNRCNDYFNLPLKENAPDVERDECFRHGEYDEDLPIRDYIEYVQPIREPPSDKIDVTEKIACDEIQPLHYVLQGTLVDHDDKNATVVREHRDFVVPSEEISTQIPVLKGTNVIDNLMIQDSDVTKYDYSLSHDYCDIYQSTDYGKALRLETPELRESARQPAEEAAPYYEIQYQAMPETGEIIAVPGTQTMPATEVPGAKPIEDIVTQTMPATRVHTIPANEAKPIENIVTQTMPKPLIFTNANQKESWHAQTIPNPAFYNNSNQQESWHAQTIPNPAFYNNSNQQESWHAQTIPNPAFYNNSNPQESWHAQTIPNPAFYNNSNQEVSWAQVQTVPHTATDNKANQEQSLAQPQTIPVKATEKKANQAESLSLAHTIPDTATDNKANQAESLAQPQTIPVKATENKANRAESLSLAQTIPDTATDNKANQAESLAQPQTIPDKATEKKANQAESLALAQTIPDTATDTKANQAMSSAQPQTILDKATENKATQAESLSLAQTVPDTATDNKANQAELSSQSNLMGTNISETPQRIDELSIKEDTSPTVGIEPVLQIETLNANQEQLQELDPLTKIDLMESSKQSDTVVQMKEVVTDVTKYDDPHNVDHQNTGVKSWNQYMPMRRNIAALEREPTVHIREQTVPKTEEAQNIQDQKQQGHASLMGDNIVKQTEKPQAMEEKRHQSTRETQAMVQSCIQTQTMPKPNEEQIVKHPEPLAEKNILNPKEATPVDEPRIMKESNLAPEIQTSFQRRAEAIPKIEQNTPKTVDDALSSLKLDTNLSLTELLRRVRARNRLLYCNECKTKMVHMFAPKQCPPTDRPQCPPPPDGYKPCPPSSRPKSKADPPPKEKSKCPPDPPKQCPPAPKCPPDPPTCAPDPPSPCPCPAPPKCPPPPPKCCSCHALDPEDLVTIPLRAAVSSASAPLLPKSRNFGEIIRRSLIEVRHILHLAFHADQTWDRQTLRLNRVRDFEPWTPIPSWPFPVREKVKKLQCPYHGCPFFKPGPVRPNCPELPCAGFPKRLSFSEV